MTSLVMNRKLYFKLAAKHKEKLKKARKWLEKVGIIMKPVIEEDSVSCIFRGHHDNYVVYIGRDGVVCSCPANRGHGYICWHIIAVFLFFYEKFPELREKLESWLEKAL